MQTIPERRAVNCNSFVFRIAIVSCLICSASPAKADEIPADALIPANDVRQIPLKRVTLSYIAKEAAEKATKSAAVVDNTTETFEEPSGQIKSIKRTSSSVMAVAVPTPKTDQPPAQDSKSAAGSSDSKTKVVGELLFERRVQVAEWSRNQLELHLNIDQKTWVGIQPHVSLFQDENCVVPVECTYSWTPAPVAATPQSNLPGSASNLPVQIDSTSSKSSTNAAAPTSRQGSTLSADGHRPVTTPPLSGPVLITLQIRTQDWPPQEMTVRVYVPIKDDMLKVDLIKSVALASEVTPIQEVLITNNSDTELTVTKGIVVTTGNQVIWKSRSLKTLAKGANHIPVSNSSTLHPPIVLRSVQLELTSAAPAPAATSTPAPATTSAAGSTSGSGSTASAGSVAVISGGTVVGAITTPALTNLSPGMTQTTTETIEQPKGVVLSTKTSETKVTAAAAAKSSTNAGTVKGMLVYEGNFNFAEASDFLLPIDPGSFDGISVEITDPSGQLPVGWSLVSDLIDAAKVTESNPQKKVGTIRISPLVYKELHVRLTIPVPASLAQMDVSYEASVGDPSTLTTKMRIKNGTSVDWVSPNESCTLQECRLTLFKDGQLVYDGADFFTLVAGATRTISQELSTIVDTKTPTIDFGSLLDNNQKPKTENLARLPLWMKLDNRGAADTRTHSSLNATTSIQIRWLDYIAPAVKRATSVQLPNPLALGPSDCCEHDPLQLPYPIGSICCTSGPYEKQPHVAFVPVGEESRLGVTAVSKNSLAPWLPLSFANGRLSYLTGENWMLQICVHHDVTPSDVRFFDSRPGFGAYVFPKIDPNLDGKGSVWSPWWSVSTQLQFASLADDTEAWAKLLVPLTANLERAIEVLRSSPSAEETQELMSYFCLDPEFRKAFQSQEVRSPHREALEEYVKSFKDRLDVASSAASNYQKIKKSLTATAEAEQGIYVQLQQFSNPVADEYALEILKLRVEIEKQRRKEQTQKTALQNAAKKLMSAVAAMR